MHCKVTCVEECISETIIRSLLQHVCFPAIQNSLTETPSSVTKVLFSFYSDHKYDLSVNTAMLLIPLILEAIPTISLIHYNSVSFIQRTCLRYNRIILLTECRHSSPISFNQHSIKSNTLKSPEHRYSCGIRSRYKHPINTTIRIPFIFASYSDERNLTSIILASCIECITSTKYHSRSHEEGRTNNL